MKEILLWDKNGMPVHAPEDDVEAFINSPANAHRELRLKRPPINLGCPKAKARAGFIANRVASLQRRYRHKHERTVADEMILGTAQADAVAAADKKWGAKPPTPKEIAVAIIDAGEIPESMREES